MRYKNNPEESDNTCYCGNPLVNNMCSYCAGTDEDYDETDDCCDWGDQIEALSDRIERLERGAKVKDASNSTWQFPPWSPSNDSKSKPAVDAVSIIFDGVEYTKREASVLAERQAIINYLHDHNVTQQVRFLTGEYKESPAYSLRALSTLISDIKAGKHNG